MALFTPTKPTEKPIEKPKEEFKNTIADAAASNLKDGWTKYDGDPKYLPKAYYGLSREPHGPLFKAYRVENIDGKVVIHQMAANMREIIVQRIMDMLDFGSI